MSNRRRKPLYFTALEIENVRCFSELQTLHLTLDDGQPARWTLILGDNGVGKSSLLQCLAWMRLVPGSDVSIGVHAGPEDTDEPPPLTEGKLGPALPEEENETLEGLLRLGKHNSLSLKATLSFGVPISGHKQAGTKSTQGTSVVAGVQLLFDSKRLLKDFKLRPRRPTVERTLGGEFHEPLVVAYGANRQLGKQNLTEGELENGVSSTRLSEFTELYDVEEILSSLHYASTVKGRKSREGTQLGRLKTAIAQILPAGVTDSDIEINPPDVLDTGEPSGVLLRTFSGLVPIPALSLGYRTTLAWTADLAWRLLKRYPSSKTPLTEPAIVLIDEIDLHLHPLWQLRIIDKLSAVFPGTQFIATAHSPLMVQVAETANLVLLRQRQNDVEIVSQPEVVRNWRVDQILMSELFNVPRARDHHTEQLFARRDILVDKVSRSAAEEQELQKLRREISQIPTAPDPEDQEAMDFIRETAALLKEHVSVK